MRLNKYIATASGLSRRAADSAIQAGRVTINGRLATIGSEISDTDTVILDNRAITPVVKSITIMLNKPVGYVCSRNGQGSHTIYDLLPPELHRLKPVGRLDKDSSGLLLMTDDGDLANRLTHPRYAKDKVYEIRLDKPLTAPDHSAVEQGIKLEDGPSRLQLKPLNPDGTAWQITMHEGRNRQIRRTFAARGYTVIKLHRTHFGDYALCQLKNGTYKNI